MADICSAFGLICRPSDLAEAEIVSRAHEVVEAMPLDRGNYVCVRCGMRGGLNVMFSNPETRCLPHSVGKYSGWLPE